MIVFHFTSGESLLQIITSKHFHPSYLNPQMDTAFGEGWYFTDLHPDTTPNEDLEQALWMRREPTKSQRWIAFDIHDSILQKCRPNVYRLRIDAITDSKIIDLNLTYKFISNGAEAIRYISYGHKKQVLKHRNPWDAFLVIALIGLGILALAN